MTARRIDRAKTAKRRGQWARLAVSGPQSSGKTRTALWLAFELGNKVLFIDTEVSGPPSEPGGPPQGAAELFDEHFPPFTHHLWEPPYAPDELAETILEEAGHFDVIVIDSGTHFWKGEGGTLRIVDEAHQSGRYGKHEGAGWSEGTPIQDQLVEALQQARCHVIFAMRSRIEWDIPTMTEIGVGPQQRKDLAYEFTLGLILDRDHAIEVNKSRIDAGGVNIPVGKKYKLREHPSLVAELKTWLGTAEELAAASSASAEDIDRVNALLNSLPEGRPRNVMKQEFLLAWGLPTDLTEVNARGALTWLEDRLGEAAPDEDQEGEEDPDPPASVEVREQIMKMFDELEGTARVGAKAEFVKVFQCNPAELVASQAEDALAWVAIAVRAGKPAAKKAAATKKVAAKKTTAKKTGARKSGGARAKGGKKPAVKKAGARKPAGSGASSPPPEPPAEERADTQEPPAGAPEGNGAAGGGLREYLTTLFVSVPGPMGLRIENALLDAELWPIDKVADSDLSKVEKILVPIAEGEAE